MNNPWITTYSGRQFFLTRATPDDIYIEDIAHALSNICRYVGQCKTFYSVAEHSVRMAKVAPGWLKLAALMHDSPEAYLNDINSIVKECLPAYQRMESYLLGVIFAKYHIQWSPEVKALDEKMRTPEVLSLFPAHNGWKLNHDFKYGHIRPWSHKKAERKFLKMFRRLCRYG